MDPPLAPPPTAAMMGVPQPLSTTAYTDSVDSSPRSRKNDSWGDETATAAAATTAALHNLVIPGSSKLRLMCSYGGHIMPRPHDKSLCYVGGDTRIVVVDRQTTLSSLSSKLSNSLMNGRSFTLKYQLPNEDLDSLISVTTDEDLDNMIEEYDRTNGNQLHTNSQKQSRLRLFLFPVKPETTQSMIGPILESTVKSDDWFLNALNSGAGGVLNRGFSDSASVNCLLGLDDVASNHSNAGFKNNSNNSNVNTELGVREADLGLLQKNIKLNNQEIQSVPDSPMLENSSSFGSTSSSPSLANMPPIHETNRMMLQPEQKMVGPGGLEEQFAAQMKISSGATGGLGQKQQTDDGNFLNISSSAPPPLPMNIIVPGVPISAGGYTDRVTPDDRKPPAPVQAPPQSQPQQKSSGGNASGGNSDLPSPDSVSSDTNPLSRQKPMNYQDPSGVSRVAASAEQKANVSDPNPRVHIQQPVQDSGYILQTQSQQPQFDLQAPQQQQYIQAGGGHYILHQPTGTGPIPSYYPMYPPQQQQQQQYPVYYMPARQQQPQQAYNLPVQQQSGITEQPTSRAQTPNILPSAANYNPMRNPPVAAKPEMAQPGMYRAAGPGGNPQLVQMQPPGQHQQQQYMGYSQQIPHQSQSAVPGNYGYEFADPSHGQIYYTQPMAPTMPSQYQTMFQEGSNNQFSENSTK